MTDQELRDEFDILSIEQKIDWALDTIRHKESFGMDELNASLSRERRAKGVLLDCKKTIEKQKKEIEEIERLLQIRAESIIRKEARIIAKDAEIESIRKELEATSIRRGYELIKQKNKSITEAILILDEIVDARNISCGNYEKAKAWLENNR